MRACEALGWSGRVRIVARDASGRVVDVWEGHNIITDAGRNLLRDFLAGAVTDGKIRYVALGDGTTTPATTDTKLASEKFRKQVTKLQNGANPGELVTTVYIAPYEATSDQFTIQEIGWFAGPSATGARDSGILVARILYFRAKTNLESLQIERTDSIGG